MVMCAALTPSRVVLKQAPLDSWSTRERLALASAVLRDGDQNWATVARSMKDFVDPDRPDDWVTQKACALQYAKLLEHANVPRLKKEAPDPVGSAMESPAESIVRKLREDRCEEVRKLVAETTSAFKLLNKEIRQLRAGQLDSQLDEISQQIAAEKEAAAQQEKRKKQWLLEREQQKQAVQQALRVQVFKTSPTQPAAPPAKRRRLLLEQAESSQSEEAGSLSESVSEPAVDSPANSLSVTAPTDADVDDASRDSDATRPPPASSPLLDSLLRSSAGGATATRGISSTDTSTAASLSTTPTVKDSTRRPSSSDATLSQLLDLPPSAPGRPLPQLNVFKDDFGEKSTAMPKTISKSNESASTSKSILILPGKSITPLIKVKLEPVVDGKELSAARKLSISTECKHKIEPDAFSSNVPSNDSMSTKSSSPSLKSSMATSSSAHHIGQDTAEANAKMSERSPSVTSVSKPSTSLSMSHAANKSDSIIIYPVSSEVKESNNVLDKPDDGPIVQHIEKGGSGDGPTVSRTINIERVKQEPSGTEEGVMGEEKTFYETSAAETPTSASGTEADPQAAKCPEKAAEAASATEATPAVESANSSQLESEELASLPQAVVKVEKADESDSEPATQCRRQRSGSSSVTNTPAAVPLPAIESFPGSPASTVLSGDDGSATDERSREHKQWKRAILMLWRELAGHRHASMFAKPITPEQAPGYREIVRFPMDLSTIKRNVESGVCSTTQQFQRDLMLMFCNAQMFNPAGHKVVEFAREMQAECIAKILQLIQAEKPTVNARRETRESSRDEQKRKRSVEGRSTPTRKRR